MVMLSRSYREVELTDKGMGVGCRRLIEQKTSIMGSVFAPNTICSMG